MSPCAVIPVYNHGDTVGAVLAALRGQDLPCFIVDDGSTPACAQVLDALSAADPVHVQLVRLPVNSGKGAAMAAGLRAALAAGHSHALQIDADGQHALTDIPLFMAQAERAPDKVICGCPIYDNSVPKARFYGRYATHVWVWINTLSLEIRDSMCGFRIYPLAETVALLDTTHIGRRMDFDTEILVRLVWRGMRLVNLPTRVLYPRGGISHFRVFRDNVLISAMHARLFVGMLWRAPVLIARRWTRAAR